MPTRMLRDWTDSEKVKLVSANAERLFTRLIMKADDHGCFHARPAMLKSMLFPLLTDSIRETDISRWLDECQKAGLIAVYEVESKPYLRIIEFGQRLRSMKSKFPLPPADECPHLPALVGLKGREVEVETEEKGNALRKYFDQSVTWHEAICMKHKVSIQSLGGYFDKFFLHMKTQQKSNLPAKEAMSYFDNWLGKQPKGNKPSKNDGNGPDLSK